MLKNKLKYTNLTFVKKKKNSHGTRNISSQVLH